MIRRRPRVRFVDCFDSFSWNVVGLLREQGAQVDVARPDANLSWTTGCDLLVLSPGPGRPADYPAVLDLARRASSSTPILGVCLGMQVLARIEGARIVHAPRPVHGKTSRVRHDGGREFLGVPRTFTAMRYHSLCVDESTLPDEFEVAARSDDGVVMALRHRTRPAFGLQFHPESFGTGQGGRILANLLASALGR